MRCNVILHGNYIVYTRRMQRKFGEVVVDDMINDKQIMKISTAEIEAMIEKYKIIVYEMKQEKGL